MVAMSGGRIDPMKNRPPVVEIEIDEAELRTRLATLGPPRTDEVTVLRDGTRLDTKDKLYAYIDAQNVRDGVPTTAELLAQQ